MNGDEKKFFKELLDEKFINLHSRIDGLKEDMKPLKNLPCRVHAQQMKGFKVRINWLYVFVTFVLIGSVFIGVLLK